MAEITAGVAPHVPTSRQIEWKKVDDELLLDPENPRLLLDAKATQPQVLRVLCESEALEELAASIGRHGFFVEEPLIVVPHEHKQGIFVVVEGNRRLATVKLLLDQRLREKLGVSDWPEAAPAVLESIRTLPTIAYPNKDAVIPYLGFRHITWIKKWDYFQKARYINRLIEAGRPIGEIEAEIGDSASTVKKLYQIFVVHRQLQRDLSMDTKSVRENFSLLEVALSQRPIKEFLGMPPRLPTGATESVVDSTNLAKLRELVSWVFGDPERGEQRVITDSRQIYERLAPVVASERSLAKLRETRDLEAAYEFSEGERNFIVKQISTADRAIERALGVAYQFVEDADILARFGAFEKRVGALRKQLKNK